MALVLQFLSTKIFQRTLSFWRKKTNSIICRSRSRFASAKVSLFRKPTKKHERNFKKIAKNGCKNDNKGRIERDIPYIYYINTPRSDF